MNKILTLVAAAVLSAPLTASATFVIGWHDFNGAGPPGPLSNTANEAPDNYYGPAGLGADLDKVSAGAISTDTGGSNDGTFGAAVLPFSPLTNNGFISMVGSIAQSLIFQLTNNTLVPMYLINMHFDAIAQTQGSSPSISVGWRIQGDETPFNVVGSTGAIPSTGGSDWSDYYFGAVAGTIPFQPGQTIEVRLLSTAGLANGVNIDNIAFTVIPEPGNMLGIGALVCSGLGMRHRRRKSVTATA